MSNSESRRLANRFKRLCAACQERKARFKYRGDVRADRDHTLCFECYRGEINRARARRLRDASLRLSQPLFEYQPAVNPVLGARQIAHRQLMLGHLQRPAVER